jgi:hypothetical protein
VAWWRPGVNNSAPHIFAAYQLVILNERPLLP